MPSDKLPRHFGRYELIGELGAGGMGVVMRGFDPQLKREVAVKILPAHLRAVPTVADRFRREALALARLSHPNIVRVFDVGEQGKLLYYVMELLPGKGLDTRRPGSGQPAPPFVPKDFVELFSPLADALALVHDAGFVHRDIKPANILTGVPERGPVLTDFGLAWIEDQSHLTQSGLIVGTGRYMAPEQVQGEAPGPLCDLYALGVTMWEYATGRLPFEDLKGEQLLIGRVAATLQPVAEAAPRVPPHLAEAIDRCVALRPADRFQGARELYRALRSGLGILDNSIESSFQDRTPRAASRRPSATGKMLVPTAATQPLESPEPGGGSHRAVAASVAMLVAAAALGAVAAVAVLRHRAAPAPVAPPIVVPPRTPSIASAVPGVEPVVTSVRPELPLRVAPESEQAWRAAVAVSATEVLVAWTCERSGLRFAASRDGGRSWQRLPPDPRLSSLGMTELKLVACEGRFHLLYYSGDDRKRVHLEYATATAGSLSFEAPRRLGSVSQSELLPALACARQRNGQVWLLAAWQSIGAGGIESAWSEDGGHSWSGAVRLPGSTTESRWPAAVVLDGSALLVWQQDPSGNRPSTLLVTRSSGPAGEWQPPRPLAVLSFGVDRCFPALASDGRRVHLQFAEKSLTGRGLVCTQSADGGRTFGSARQVGNWPCNDRHNALAARENRIWSTWEDKTARENVWAASSDGGRLWSREKELQPFVTESKPASIAVSPDGECWAAWASESGEVGAMRLP